MTLEEDVVYLSKVLSQLHLYTSDELRNTLRRTIEIAFRFIDSSKTP
jgi:hypothetical protein